MKVVQVPAMKDYLHYPSLINFSCCPVEPRVLVNLTACPHFPPHWWKAHINFIGSWSKADESKDPAAAPAL